MTRPSYDGKDGMDHIYQFKFHLRHVSIHGLGVFVIGEREHYLLTGELYTQLCPLIDGRRTVGELVAALAGTLSPPEVLYGVHRLLDGGYLTEVAPTVPPASAAFWQSLGVDPAVAAHNLARRPVTVETVGDLEPVTVDCSPAKHGGLRAGTGAHPRGSSGGLLNASARGYQPPCSRTAARLDARQTPRDGVLDRPHVPSLGKDPVGPV